MTPPKPKYNPGQHVYWKNTEGCGDGVITRAYHEGNWWYYFGSACCWVPEKIITHSHEDTQR